MSEVEDKARELAQLMPMWGFDHTTAIRITARLATIVRSMSPEIYQQLAGGARVIPKEDNENAPANSNRSPE